MHVGLEYYCWQGSSAQWHRQAAGGRAHSLFKRAKNWLVDANIWAGNQASEGFFEAAGFALAHQTYRQHLHSDAESLAALGEQDPSTFSGAIWKEATVIAAGLFLILVLLAWS